MTLERPNPPVVVKVTYHTIELEWSHVKASLDPTKRYKFKLQEVCNMFKKSEWSTVYTGLGFSSTVTGLEPSTLYSYRLNITCNNNERSEYSQPVEVKTTRQPNSGEEFQKAIMADNRTTVTNLANSQGGEKFFELPDNLGNLPLMILMKRDGFDRHANIEMLELLIKLGANVNAQNVNSKTALMMAAFYGKVLLCKILRKHGANYDLKDNTGKKAIHYAVDGGDAETVRYLLDTGANANDIEEASGWSPLLRVACLNGSADVVQLLIKYGADVNYTDREKKSALVIASINGNLPIVTALITNGANFHATNGAGKSIYELARSMGRKDLLDFFDTFAKNNEIKEFGSSRKISV